MTNETSMDIYRNIPHELKERRQWVVWRLERRDNRSKPTKVPYQINGMKADSMDPQTWTAFDEVVHAANEYNGIGYIFSKDDPYTGIDFDNCVRSGAIKESVKENLKRLNSYTERSQSGTGVHAIVRAKLPSENGRKNTQQDIEVYDWGRFFVMTGQHVQGAPLIIEPRQEELNQFFNEYFPPRQERERHPQEQAGRTYLNDDEVIQKASNARNSERFRNLFFNGPESDHSSSDLALCNIIAFYTQDFEQIDRIFRQSALMRDKWEREDYSTNTIERAIGDLTGTYTPPRERTQEQMESGAGFRPIIPSGWELSESGALYMKRKNAKGEDLPPMLVTHEPIILSGRYLNYTNKTQGLVLAWLKDGKWRQKKVKRDEIMIHNNLMKLSLDGVPVNSVNAKNLVRYLYDFETANSNQIPLNIASEKNGWINKGFLLGNIFIDQDGNERGQNDAGSVYNLATSNGEDMIAKRISTNGTLEGQIAILDGLKNYHRVTAGIYASLASVLLRILRATPFVFEWAYETSKGKTIAQQIAASVWGNPNENQGIIQTWNTTHVGVERIASFMNDLPTFLDDTKKQPRKDLLNEVVYQHSSGISKIRGTKEGGIQDLKTWNNILITTGENKITAYKNDGGTAARVLSISEMPFGKANEESYFMVNKLKNDIEDHYGHIGKEFIKYLLKHRNEWDALRQKHQELKKIYADRSNTFNSVAARMGDTIATLHMASMVFQKCFNLNWGYEGLYKLWDEMMNVENTDTDRPKEALQKVYDWCVTNKFQFNEDQRLQVTYGEWNYNSDQWQDIKINPQLLEEFLTKKDYEPRSIFKSWKDRGWLDVSHGYRKRVKRNQIEVYFIAIKREALEQ